MGSTRIRQPHVRYEVLESRKGSKQLRRPVSPAKERKFGEIATEFVQVKLNSGGLMRTILHL